MASPLTISRSAKLSSQLQNGLKSRHFRSSQHAFAGKGWQAQCLVLFVLLAAELRACSSFVSAESENVPSVGDYVAVGMTKNDAIHELQARHVDFRYVAETNSIEAMQRNVSRSFSIWTSVAYSVQLNSEDRVSSVSKRDVYTGP